MNDHIAENYHALKTKNQGAKFFILGDFNDHKPDTILALSPQLRQTIHYPTCGQHTLDLCITDAHVLYHPPLPDPPLLPDDPQTACPSDHSGSIFIPRFHQGIKSSRVHKEITVRPITKSQMNTFGNWLVNEGWEAVLADNDVDSKLDVFTTYVFTMLDAIAPVKKIRISCDDPA